MLASAMLQRARCLKARIVVEPRDNLQAGLA
jgi:hypothetical protein